MTTQTLVQALAEEDQRHKERVLRIRRKYKFIDGDAEVRLKMLVEDRSGMNPHFYMLSTEDRMRIAKVFFLKAHVMTGYITTHSYLSLGSLKMSGDYYNVEVSLLPGVKVTLAKDLRPKPSPERVIEIVQSVFGNKKVTVEEKQV